MITQLKRVSEEANLRQRMARCQTFKHALSVAAALLLTACGPGMTAYEQSALQVAKSGRPEDFLIVDCLLPGQIRQLGQSVTYVTRRQAVKTSQRDCEIRGGEYVALDRSNYATALKVWLP